VALEELAATLKEINNNFIKDIWAILIK
jgi:hypothetical protein